MAPLLLAPPGPAWPQGLPGPGEQPEPVRHFREEKSEPWGCASLWAQGRPIQGPGPKTLPHASAGGRGAPGVAVVGALLGLVCAMAPWPQEPAGPCSRAEAPVPLPEPLCMTRAAGLALAPRARQTWAVLPAANSAMCPWAGPGALLPSPVTWDGPPLCGCCQVPHSGADQPVCSPDSAHCLPPSQKLLSRAPLVTGASPGCQSSPQGWLPVALVPRALSERLPGLGADGGDGSAAAPLFWEDPWEVQVPSKAQHLLLRRCGLQLNFLAPLSPRGLLRGSQQHSAFFNAAQPLRSCFSFPQIYCGSPTRASLQEQSGEGSEPAPPAEAGRGAPV